MQPGTEDSHATRRIMLASNLLLQYDLLQYDKVGRGKTRTCNVHGEGAQTIQTAEGPCIHHSTRIAIRRTQCAQHKPCHSHLRKGCKG